MYKRKKYIPIIYSNEMEMHEINELNYQFEMIPLFWRKRFLEDGWQFDITKKKQGKISGIEYYMDNIEKKIRISFLNSVDYNYIIFRTFAFYIYMEYGNFSQYSFFKKIYIENKDIINRFMISRKLQSSKSDIIFAEMFSYIIENCDVQYKNTSLYWYVNMWLSGKIFNRNIINIPDFIEFESWVIDEQIKCTILAFNKLPVKIKQNFLKDEWKIHISDRKIIEVKSDSIDGLCSSFYKKIFIRSSSSDIRRTLFHEFGHYIDFKENNISETDLVYKSFINEKVYFKRMYCNKQMYNYAVSSVEEYFAELFVNYFMHRDKLRCVVPRSFDIFDKILKKWL